jgi:flagellar motor switch protein FliN/FliY
MDEEIRASTPQKTPAENDNGSEHRQVVQTPSAAESTRRVSAALPNDNLSLVMDVPLEVTAELGRTSMTVRQVLDLQPGSVIELDRLAGEPVDIYVNDQLLGKGEVVVVDDKFGIRLSELPSENEGNVREA